MQRVLPAVFVLLYPLLVYVALGRGGLRWMAVLLAGVAVLRAVLVREWVSWWLAAGAVLLAALTFISNAALPLKIYPVLVSLGFLAIFGVSLLHGPSAIERIARLRDPDLSPEGVKYTRRVTQIWCGFFIFNATTAAILAIWASDAWWALYTGILSYLLMGILFAGEWILRPRFVSAVRHG